MGFLGRLFGSDTAAKAAALAENLAATGDEARHGQDSYDKRNFIVTGSTTRIRMEAANVVDWVKAMCELGFSRDAEFEGWGTNPTQDGAP